MKKCNACGNEEVTDSFHRAYSDNNGVLHGCKDCCTERELPVRPCDRDSEVQLSGNRDWRNIQ